MQEKILKRLGFKWLMVAQTIFLVIGIIIIAWLWTSIISKQSLLKKELDMAENYKVSSPKNNHKKKETTAPFKWHLPSHIKTIEIQAPKKRKASKSIVTSNFKSELSGDFFALLKFLYELETRENPTVIKMASFYRIDNKKNVSGLELEIETLETIIP